MKEMTPSNPCQSMTLSLAVGRTGKCLKDKTVKPIHHGYSLRVYLPHISLPCDQFTTMLKNSPSFSFPKDPPPNT